MNSLCLKIILNDFYREEHSVATLLDYTNKQNLGLTTGINCSADAAIACQQFQNINLFHCKTPSIYIRHLMISSDTIKDEIQMLQLAYRIGEFFKPHYQVFIGVHTDTDHLHAHFIMNKVSWDTGNIYRGYYDEKAAFIQHINNLGYFVECLDTHF